MPYTIQTCVSRSHTPLVFWHWHDLLGCYTKVDLLQVMGERIWTHVEQGTPMQVLWTMAMRYQVYFQNMIEMVRGRQIKSQPSVKFGVMTGTEWPHYSYHYTGTIRLHCNLRTARDITALPVALKFCGNFILWSLTKGISPFLNPNIHSETMS